MQNVHCRFILFYPTLSEKVAIRGLRIWDVALCQVAVWCWEDTSLCTSVFSSANKGLGLKTHSSSDSETVLTRTCDWPEHCACLLGLDCTLVSPCALRHRDFPSYREMRSVFNWKLVKLFIWMPFGKLETFWVYPMFPTRLSASERHSFLSYSLFSYPVSTKYLMYI